MQVQAVTHYLITAAFFLGLIAVGTVMALRFFAKQPVYCRACRKVIRHGEPLVGGPNGLAHLVCK